MSDIFASPQRLWGLFYAAAMAYLILRLIPKKRKFFLNLLIKNPLLQQQLLNPKLQDLRPIKNALLALALTLATLALAGPQWGIKSEMVPALAGNMVICLDLSQSMQAQDIEPSRFERTKLELIEAYGKNAAKNPFRIGVVTFAGRAYLQCPLTLDTSALRFILESVAPGSLPYPGTNIAMGLEIAQAVLNPVAGNKQILLVTDGEEHEGSAQSQINELLKARIKVSVLWSGRTQPEPIPLRDENGQFLGYKKNSEGQPVLSRANPTGLEKLAQATGGNFIRLEDGGDIAGQLQTFTAGPETGKGREKRMTLENRFQIPLFAGFLLLVIELAIPEKKKRPS